MRRGFWILWVLFVTACSSSRYAEPAMESADEGDKAFETECDKHEDCYPEHTFCVKGLCTGEPQPENLPVEEGKEKDNEPAAEAADFTIGGNPWGDDLNYLGTESAEEPPAEEPPAEEPPVEEPPTEEPPVEEPPTEEPPVEEPPVEEPPPLECVASAEVCDGLDNDCDGVADDGVLNICGECGDVPVEVCDEVDNDCDGAVDEDVLNACGKCGGAPYEYCNGLDDDCDGEVDEVCACFANAEQKCTTTDFVYYELGECVYGKQKCISGEWSECVGAVSPVAETCDGLDNDCDGETDDGALKPDGSCIECLSDNDCEPGGGCSCTAEGNLKCVAIGICVAGDCTVQLEEMKCAFGCSDEKWACLECADDSHCDDGNGCTIDACSNGICKHTNKCVDYDGELGVMLTCDSDSDCQGKGFGDYCYYNHCYPCVNASNMYIACQNKDQVCTWKSIPVSDDKAMYKFECVNPECKTNLDCDDGDICTNDMCGYPYCINTKIENCVKCKTDNDCAKSVWCNDKVGGVYLAPGTCHFFMDNSDGACDVEYSVTAEDSKKYNCPNPIECSEESDCPGGSCVNWYCYYENGQYPECVKDENCGVVGQFCNAEHECDWQGDLQCTFQCPPEMKYAVVWFGANQTANIECATGVFKVSPETLCLWGQANPTFKYNLWDGQNWWSWGEKAVLSCNDETFKVAPDPNLGNAGVQIVSFTDLTCSF